jgi:hypothetical protein
VSVGRKRRSDVAVGAREFHRTFGNGIVTAIDDNTLEIDFEHAGASHVLDSFCRSGGVASASSDPGCEKRGDWSRPNVGRSRSLR